VNVAAAEGYYALLDALHTHTRTVLDDGVVADVVDSSVAAAVAAAYTAVADGGNCHLCRYLHSDCTFEDPCCVYVSFVDLSCICYCT
jgi:hypothetical protein